MNQNIIKTLEIHNFQSHGDTVFNLHPGINAIVGDSDKGKSAALRSLFWAITNKPAGDSHISDWCRNEKGQLKKGQECRVTVRTVGGRTCARIRSSEMNGYELDGVLCEAIRTEIPQDVAEFFNFSEVNVQRQADAPFLLAAPAGEVARFFNRIIKLEEIDLVLANIESRRRKTKAQIEDNAKEQETTSAKFKGMAWVDTLQAKITIAEGIYSQLATLRDGAETIERELQQYRAHEAKLAVAGAVALSKTHLETAKDLRDKVQFAAIRVNTISASLREYEPHRIYKTSARGIVTHGPDLIAKARNAQTQINALGPKCAGMAEDLAVFYRSQVLLERKKPLEQASACVEGLRKLATRIQNKTQSIVVLAAEVSGYMFQQKLHITASEEFRTLIGQRPAVCPTCGKAWNHE